MNLNTQFKEEYLSDWPKNWYPLTPPQRLCALQEQLRRYPDSPEDRRRMEVFQLRYDSSFNDHFMNAWMMLKVAEATAPSFLMKRKYRADVLDQLAKLGIGEQEADIVLMEEWVGFADLMIRTYVSSPSFRSAVFGMGSVSDRNTSRRLASEIEAVTKTVPARIGADAMVQAFRSIVTERFLILIPDGESILREIQSR